VDTTDPSYGGGFPAPLPYAPCGYTPPQLRSAYGMDKVVNQGNTGQGVTVAVIDAFVAPTLFADAQHYAALNDPTHPLNANQFSERIFKTNHSQEPPDQCDAAGWYGEQTLDVEAVHAMAPGANIVYVGASDCQDPSLDKALNTVVGEHLASIVSNSYGDLGEDIAPQEVATFHQIVVNAALEGIGVYFSSGDDGDEVSTLGQRTVDFPASDPFVIAVGGTSLAVGASGRTLFETGWETGKSTLVGTRYKPAAPGAFLYGSGGGTSRLYEEPTYQVGVVPNALATQNHPHGGVGRVVPDISVDGDPNTGMLVGETQTFPDGVYYDQYRIGGTSLSCPLFAGIMALADSAAGESHGFVNPTLYGDLAGTSALKDVQHVNAAEARVDFLNGVDAADGTVTSGRPFDLLGLAIASTPGYDNVTGLGTPNGVAFVQALS
jgi:subtilase family serine protease